MSERAAGRFVSIGTKLSALIFALVSLVSTFVYVDSTEKTRESLLQAKRSTASTVVELVASSLVAPLDFNDNEAIQVELNHLATNEDIIYAAAFAADKDEPIAVLHRRGLEAITRGADGSIASAPRVVALPDPIEITHDVVSPTGKKLGSVTLHVSLARESAAFRSRQRTTLALAIGLTIALAGLIIGLTRRMLLSPIMRLAEAARRVEQGSEASVSVTSNDEIGALGGAFNAMAAAIGDRERRLAKARSSLQEVLDTMRQAIIVFGPGGVIEGSMSQQTRAIFGEDAAEGRRVLDLLYPGALPEDIEPRAFEEWLTLAFEAPAAQWAEIVELAPREVELARGGMDPLHIELELRPFIEGDVICRVMLLATDESEKRRLEREVASRERENARQLVTTRRLIASGPQAFLGFLDASEERVSRSLSVLSTAASEARPITLEDVDAIFRHVHTLKGEARSEGLRDLEHEAATIEERLADALDRMDAGKNAGKKVVTAIREALARAREQLESARRLFVEASPIGEAVLDQVTVSRAALDKVHAIVTARSAIRLCAADDELSVAVTALASRPFGECAARTLEAAPGWALARGKQAQIDVIGREIPVPREVVSVLRGALAQIVRNAVAHGIEAPDERERAGKPPYGSIVIRCASSDAGVGTQKNAITITIDDDGRGLDLEAIRARASELGLGGAKENENESPSRAADLIFHQGLSTADGVDDLAGRGVGLAAVRAELSSIGWEIAVSSEIGRGTRFTLSSTSSGLSPMEIPMIQRGGAR